MDIQKEVSERKWLELWGQISLEMEVSNESSGAKSHWRWVVQVVETNVQIWTIREKGQSIKKIVIIS